MDESKQPVSRIGAPGVIAIFAVLLIGGLWISLIAEMEHDRATVQRSAEVQAANLARTFEEHVRRAASSIDLVLLHLRDEIADGQPIDRQLDLLRRRLPSELVFQVAIIDADGHLRYVSLRAAEPVDLSDRDHFRVHRDTTADRLFISKPVLGRVSGRMSIQFTRRLDQPDGRFAGVLVFSADPAYFVSMYRSIDIGENGAVMLVGSDRVVRAGAARRTDVIPPPGALAADDYFAADRPNDGVYARTCPVDGGQRVAAYRRIAEMDLAVVVDLCLGDIMAPARERAVVLTGGGVVVSLLLLGAFATTGRLLIRRQRDGDALAAQALSLRRSNSELEAFAYAISHDLREPLRTINGFLGLLIRRAGAKLSAEETEFIDFARNGASRMDSLINGLLEYSRVGRNESAFEPVSLATVVDTALANLRGTLTSSHAAVSVLPGLPDVLGHGDELVRLLQNLIGNALKYHSPDRPPTISIAWRRQGRDWIISVTDNGIGIAAEHHERIFGIFQRLHGRDEYDGTGIGLALCRKIVEHHHGRIWVNSWEGEGSAFFIALPALAERS